VGLFNIYMCFHYNSLVWYYVCIAIKWVRFQITSCTHRNHIYTYSIIPFISLLYYLMHTLLNTNTKYPTSQLNPWMRNVFRVSDNLLYKAQNIPQTINENYILSTCSFLSGTIFIFSIFISYRFQKLIILLVHVSVLKLRFFK
jgi:hypothetical protein